MRSGKEFAACFDSGRRYHCRSFLLFVLARPRSEDSWRLGMAVGKKVGGAVQRNRVKRILREFFRLNGQLMAAAVDVVAVPKRGLDPKSLTLAAATRELRPLLTRIANDFNRPSAAGEQS